MRRYKKLILKIVTAKKLKSEFGFNIAYVSSMASIFHKENKLGRYFTNKKEKAIKKYIYTVTEDVQKKYKNICEKKYRIQMDSKIWVFWWQGIDNAPELVKLCIESIKKNLDNHELIIIDKNNLEKYINLPDYIYQKFNKGEMCTANFADIIRVALLAEYGGIWLDATIFMTSPFNDEFYNYEFCSNKRKNQPTSLLYPAKCRWGTYFLASGKENLLFKYVRDVFYEYWKYHDMCIDYGMIDFVIDLAYDNNEKVRKMMDEAPYYGEKIHYLLPLLNDVYNVEEYKEIIAENNIHKLSYKVKLKDEINGLQTFYGYIKGKK